MKHKTRKLIKIGTKIREVRCLECRDGMAYYGKCRYCHGSGVTTVKFTVYKSTNLKI